MIKGLKCSQSIVSWYYNGHKEVQIENAFFAVEIEENELISVECGENFIAEEICFLDFNGKLVLKYNLSNGKIEWDLQGCQREYISENLNQVLYVREKGCLIIMNDRTNVQGIDLNARVLFNCHIPVGYTPVYITTDRKGEILVCDGDENHTDAYGRFRMNFHIDTITGELVKGTIAY